MLRLKGETCYKTGHTESIHKLVAMSASLPDRFILGETVPCTYWILDMLGLGADLDSM